MASSHFVFTLVFELGPVLSSESVELVILESSLIVIISFINAIFVDESSVAIEHLVPV